MGDVCYCYCNNIIGLHLIYYIKFLQKLKILYIILKFILRIRYYTNSLQIRIICNIIPRQNSNLFYKYNHQGTEFEREGNYLYNDNSKVIVEVIISCRKNS